MCFRPTTATKTTKCPNCGKVVKMTAGIKTKKCPYCGGEMENKSGEKDVKKDN